MEKALADVLLETKELIADEDKWVTGDWVRCNVADKDRQEVSYCIEGALMEVLGLIHWDWRETNEYGYGGWIYRFERDELRETSEYKFLLKLAIEREIIFPDAELAGVNDDHAHSDVMGFLDLAIEIAKKM